MKDNRLLLNGSDKVAAANDIAIKGVAYNDENFGGGGDRIRYRLSLDENVDAVTVIARMIYQPIAYSLSPIAGRRICANTTLSKPIASLVTIKIIPKRPRRFSQRRESAIRPRVVFLYGEFVNSFTYPGPGLIK